ncbi:reverse transcriptase domain-containing protein [Tanacetum coccineum]|uniref:Reverse transcriptase domain-containing protein n=1 Tax=Tanacetum coccineum TaxID=301880 RepID=A0ABQ5BTQ0_9ASTR
MFSLVWIMPPRVMTRSSGRPAATPRGRGTGGRVGRGGRRVKEPMRRNVKPTGEPKGQGNDQGVEVNGAQVGNQGSNQGDNRNQSGTTVDDNIQGDEYDGKGGVIVYTRWIETMESVQDMSGCRDGQKVKYHTGSFVGKALTWWNYQIHTRSHEVVVSMACDDFKVLMREEFCPSKEMQKLEIELWNHAMVRVGHVAYTDRFHELDRLVPHLVTLKNRRIKRYVYSIASQIRGMVAAMEPTTIQSVVLKAGVLTDEAIRNGSIKKNPKKRGNRGEPSKDRNVRDDNKRSRNVSAFATILFDSGAHYSFVSTTFIPLLGIEPSDLGFSYEIKIAIRQLAEIDKVIKGCKLEIEGHVFDINLIPFGSRSFDVIIGMD